MEIQFYRAFEDRYRGSRELIKSRQEIYLPFIEPLLSSYTEPQAIDLGCGRGEWLELLQPAFGAGARGVDLDEGMLEVCRQLGLSATNADAVTALKELPDESQLVVSGFHIAEHLDFPDLQVLIQEALRVLKPAGLLILETPNPENLQVGSCNFYLDPTHNRPLPPQLLSFLAEYQGFARVKVLRLQEDKAIVDSTWVGLREVLTGVSPDYAVIAQKAGDATLLEATSAWFTTEYGLTAASLMGKYDLQSHQLKEQMTQYEAQLESLMDKYDLQSRQLKEQMAQYEAQLKSSADRAGAAAELTATHNLLVEKFDQQAQEATQIARKAEVQAQHASELAARSEAHVQHLDKTLSDVYQSRSWRLTAPLRWGNLQIHRLREEGFAARTNALIRKAGRPLVRQGIAFVDARPALRERCIEWARKRGLYQTTRTRYLRFTGRTPASPFPSTEMQGSEGGADCPFEQMSTRGQLIYNELKAALDKNRSAR